MITKPTSTLSSNSNFIDQLIAVVTFLFILSSLVLFIYNQPHVSAKYLISIFFILAIMQGKRNDNQLTLVLVSLFLVVHSLLYVYLSTPIALLVILFFLLGSINLVLYTFLKNLLSAPDLIVINFLIISSFTIALIMPTSLFNLTTLTSLPFLISIPVIIKKTTPIKPYLLHALITGLVGAGLITSSAVMFG